MKFFRLALAAAIALAPVAGIAQTLDRIKQRGILTIAFDPNVPPWSFKDADLHYAGYEYLVAKQFADDHDLELEVVETNGANRIPLLMTNKVDLVFAAMTITPERKEVISFSLPYGGTQTAVNGPADLAIASADDLAGQRIAVARGTLQDDQVTKIAPSGAQVVRFEDESTALTSILSGQMDLIAQATSLNKTLMERDPSLNIEPKVVLGTGMHGIGMRKGEDDLKAWVDEWVEAKMKDGTLQRFFEEIHGIPMPENVVEAASNGVNP